MINDVNIDKRTIQFLENHQDLINTVKMQDLYDLFIKYRNASPYPVSNDELLTNQLTYVFIKAGFQPLKFMNSVPKGYAYNLGLEEVIIPSCITVIGEGAFVGNPSLKYLELTDSIRKIAKGAFGAFMTNCDVQYVGDVDNYVSTKNIGQLASATTTLLINNAKPVVIDIHSAKRIEDLVFYSQNVESLRLGKQITYIGWNAFNHCNGLNKIVYDGTVDQFNHIDIKPKAFADISAKIITCSDGEIQVGDLD